MSKSFYIQFITAITLLLVSYAASAQFEGGQGSGHDTLDFYNAGCNSFLGDSNSGYTAEHNPSGGNCNMFVGDSSSGHFASQPSLSVCSMFIGGDFSGDNNTHYVNPHACAQFTESPNGGSGHSSRSFTSDNSDCAIIALAIEASPLFGEIIDGRGRLHWETYTERNNMGFEVQKTYDGQNWETIGWVNGAGSSSSRLEYEFFDSNLSSTGQYYRFKQLDFDGAFSYSNIVFLNLDAPASLEDIFVLYPNPNTSFNALKLKGWVQKDWNVQLQISDPTGRILFSDKHVFGPGTEVFEFPVDFFVPGTYYLFLQPEETAVGLQIPFVIMN